MNRNSLFKVGSRRLLGALREEIYLGAGSALTRPETIRPVVTRRCNYKCQYCYDWQRTEYPEISIDDWKTALLGLRDYIGKYYVLFSGGEPFVKKGFVDLLAFCHEHGIEWSVITNGSALNRQVVERVVAATPLNVDVSVDSPAPEINDHIRGAKESLRDIGDGLRLLNSERKRQRKHFIIRAKPTVTRQNFSGLPGLVAWVIEHGADSIDFSPVRPGEYWKWDTAIRDNLWIGEDQLPAFRRVVGTLIDLKQRGAPIETPVEKLLSLPDHFLGKEINHGASPCRVGLRDFHILPNGDVSVCWEHPNIGNLIRQTAREIWESKLAGDLRARTITCNLFSTIRCANSCLNHKTLKQEFGRAIHWLKFSP